MSIAYDYSREAIARGFGRQTPPAADRRPARPVRLRAHLQDPQSGHRAGHRHRCRRQRGRCRSRRRRGPPRLRRPLAQHARLRTRTDPAPARRPDERARRRNRSARKPRRRQADRRRAAAGPARPPSIRCVTTPAGPTRSAARSSPTREDSLTYTMREPVGVVAAIIPWNFPLMIGDWKLAPALACGCTIVMKPAELTSLSRLADRRAGARSGLAARRAQHRPRPRPLVGDALVNHPDVDKVTFTGSPGVGRGIQRGAAGNFKRVSLELGGKSANVIFDDADIEAAGKAAASESSSMPDRSARRARACWPMRRFMTRWSSG